MNVSPERKSASEERAPVSIGSVPPVNRTHCVGGMAVVPGWDVDGSSADPGDESTGVSPRKLEHAASDTATERRGTEVNRLTNTRDANS
jgi:hypothetical protein